MSNRSLKERIRQAIEGFENGQIRFVHLIDVVENTGAAMEAIPYDMVRELRSIESRLAIERGYEEEDPESKPVTALLKLKSWLERVPD